MGKNRGPRVVTIEDVCDEFFAIDPLLASKVLYTMQVLSSRFAPDSPVRVFVAALMDSAEKKRQELSRTINNMTAI